MRAARRARALPLLALLLAACGGRAEAPAAEELAGLPWDSVVARAQGTTVTWRMWRGDPSVNAFVDEWVAPRLRERYGIRLDAVSGQGQELVNQLVLERRAGGRGTADLMWINGETFHNLRAGELLWGPWAHRIPAAAYVDSASSIVMLDFEQELGGWESPWGRVQFALIYDTVRTPDPPRSFAELREWILRNPGRFTHDQQFTGVTFLKGLMYALNGGPEALQGGFDEARYRAASEPVWAWLGEVRGSFWRGGQAYPPGVAELHRLFANREVDFSMSNNHNEVVSKVRQGILPPTSRALVLREGTIANAHYVGIPFNAPNPAGAMVVADFLLSPEAQLQKLQPDVWADGTVLSLERLPPEWRARFEALGADPRAIPADTLRRYARPEVAPQFHERIQADWRTRVRGNTP